MTGQGRAAVAAPKQPQRHRRRAGRTWGQPQAAVADVRSSDSHSCGLPGRTAVARILILVASSHHYMYASLCHSPHGII
jgi:hypothetical protein